MSIFYLLAIHILVFLSLFALFGYLKTEKKQLLFFTVLSFYGALCFLFKALFETILK